MKLKNTKIIFIIIILLSIFSGCTTRFKDAVVEDIVVQAGTYEYSYYDTIAGNEITYMKETEESSLLIILNDWISDLIQQNVNYGNTPDGNSILCDLEVKAAYLDKNTIIIIVNKAFIYFDNGYSQPVYFLNGLRNILGQVTEASEFSIAVEGYKSSIIHPDGVSIKNITIRIQEN